MRSIITVSASLLLAISMQSAHAANPSPEGEFVQIISVSPALGTALRVGEKVALTVEVEYVFPGESGTLNLVVQAADNSSVAHDGDVVLKGNGKVTLSATFVVPATKMIQIFTPLAQQGASGTSTVDSRSFKVVAN